jgi:anti-sigma B factor antagonist
MKIETTTREEITVVALTGELDGRTAPVVQKELMPLTEPGCKILLDLSGVTYMSSAGLRTLLLLYRQIDAEDGRVVLVGLREMIRDTMAVTGFLDFFDDYAALDQGVVALTQPVQEK